MLLIQPWEAKMVREIEKAILTSDLGINPTNDGKVIRLSFPELTEERRKELAKEVKKKGEAAFHIIAQQFHQGADFLPGTAPVFCRKSVDSQIFDPHIPGFPADCLYIFRPLGMTVIPGHFMLFGPPSVSVQNNCYMLWNIHKILQ